MSENKHNQRVAIVTGAASGIGKEIAEALARDRVTVVISDINQEAGQTIAESVNGYYLHADLERRSDCIRLVENTMKQYGRIDILVNNAGFQYISSIDTFPEDIWERMIQLMLVAPFILTKHVWPAMKQEGWGRIINMGSVHSQVASLYKSAYISAKHGLLGLTRASALKGGEYGITVNTICPAYVRTPLVENQIAEQAKNLGIERDEVEGQVFLKSAAVKRLIEPAEVARLVCYLCSEYTGAVTGSKGQA